MLQDVIVPEVSDGVTAGTVISIAVAVGDQVEEDQTLLELETDKAVVAIPSPAEGKIVEIKVSEGGEATVGSVIMVVDVEAGQSADGETEETREEAVPAEAESAESEAESPVVEEPQSTDREVDSSPDSTRLILNLSGVAMMLLLRHLQCAVSRVNWESIFTCLKAVGRGAGLMKTMSGALFATRWRMTLMSPGRGRFPRCDSFPISIAGGLWSEKH